MANLSGVAELTILARVYIPAGANDGTKRNVFSVGIPGGVQGVILRQGNGTLPTWDFQWYNGTTFVYCRSSGAENAVEGWTNVAGSLSCSGDTMFLWVNGVSVPLSGGSVASIGASIDANIPGGPNSVMWAGQSQAPGDPWLGEIQFIKIVGRALEAQEITNFFSGIEAFTRDELLHEWSFSTAGDGSLDDGATAASYPLPAGVSASLPAEVRQAIPDLSALRYYPLTESSGQGLMDASPRGRHGTGTGGPTLDAAGLIFDGVDDFVDLPDGFSSLSGGYTAYIEAKFDRAGFPGNERLYQMTTAGGTNDLVLLARENATQLDATDWNGSQVTNWTVGGDISDLLWHKVLVVRAADGTRRLFIDDSTTPAASSAASALPQDVVRVDNYLGNGGGAPTFQGKMKHFAFWDRPLSDLEIAAVMDGSALILDADPHFANVELMLKFEDGAQATAPTDTMGNYSPIFSNDAQITTVAKRYGAGSAVFDGEQDSIEFSVSPMPALGTPFTAECFFNIQGPDSLGRGRCIWGQPNTSGSSDNYLLVGAYGVLQYFRRAIGGATQLVMSTAQGYVSELEWHHVAQVFDGVEYRIYLDGVLALQAADTYGWAHGNAPFRIGLGLVDSLPTYRNSFNGYIDEVRITHGVARYTEDFIPPLASYPEQ